MELRRELTAADAQAALDQLLALRVRRVDTAPVSPWPTRSYVVIARRLGVALVTGDVRLSQRPAGGSLRCKSSTGEPGSTQPDPTWSDHFGHAWSGWCEEFAEQAEGFQFNFGSAMQDYTWGRDHGRIVGSTPIPILRSARWSSTAEGTVTATSR
jgi:hypothetical protein